MVQMSFGEEAQQTACGTSEPIEFIAKKSP